MQQPKRVARKGRPASLAPKKAFGVPAVGINKEGLKRRKFSEESIRALQDAFKFLIKSTCSHKVALERVEEIAQRDENVRMMLDFLDASERGWIR